MHRLANARKECDAALHLKRLEVFREQLPRGERVASAAGPLNPLLTRLRLEPGATPESRTPAVPTAPPKPAPPQRAGTRTAGSILDQVAMLAETHEGIEIAGRFAGPSLSVPEPKNRSAWVALAR
jgi:hypothetical protein